MTPLQQLQQLDLADQRRRFPNLPETLIIKTVYSDKTANALTRCIITWLTLHGALAERISSGGRYIQGKSIAKGFYGNVNLKGKFIKGTTRNGTADIAATFKNKKGEVVSWKIEVKINDKMSIAQKQYAEDARKAGAVYTVCHNFTEFINQWEGLCQ